MTGVCSLLRAEAGSRPGGRGTCSLLRQRKVPKRKATRSLGPLRCATGQPAVLGASGVWRNSLRSDMRQPLSAAPCAPRPSPTGLAVQRAFAALGHQRQRALRAALGRREFASNLIAACAHRTCAKRQFYSKNKAWRAAPATTGRAQQRPVGLQNPLRLGRGAQGAAGCRDSGRRGLSERSEFRSRLPAPSTAGCPVAQRRGPRRRVAFSCLLLLAKQKK